MLRPLWVMPVRVCLLGYNDQPKAFSHIKYFEKLPVYIQVCMLRARSVKPVRVYFLGYSS